MYVVSLLMWFWDWRLGCIAHRTQNFDQTLLSAEFSVNPIGPLSFEVTYFFHPTSQSALIGGFKVWAFFGNFQSTIGDFHSVTRFHRLLVIIQPLENDIPLFKTCVTSDSHERKGVMFTSLNKWVS